MKSFTLKDIALAGLIAAVYAVLGLVFAPFSFGAYQVRVAEALTVLPFLFRAAIPGLFIGCMLTNAYGGQGWYDIVFGSVITLGAAVLTRLISRLPRTPTVSFASILPMLLLWGGGVMLVCHGSFNAVVLASALVSFVLLLATMSPGNRKQLPKSLTSAMWFLSALVMVVGIGMSPVLTNWKVSLMGVLALLAAWVLTFYLISMQRTGENSNLLIAPLPPVVLNAFGVSLYLAPIYELNYWFVVQMIGIGQLIACYVLGLPLLRLLLKRRSLLA